MQNYYRYGEFDNCFGKWGDLVDCLTLKTKRVAEAEEILIAREKAKPHIWTFRTVDDASEHWWRMYKHLVMFSAPMPVKRKQLCTSVLKRMGPKLADCCKQAKAKTFSQCPLKVAVPISSELLGYDLKLCVY
ncbi:unnamed protein product [Urochloa humidicola]